MAEIPKRRIDDAGPLIPTVDGVYWKAEAEMLRHRLTLLQEYIKACGIVNSVWSQAEECRHLEYEIQCLVATIAKAGKSQEAESFAKELIERNMPRKPVEFDIWLQDHREFKDRLHQHAGSVEKNLIKGSYRCYSSACDHYVYGFASAGDLQAHLELHRFSPREPPRPHRREISYPYSYRASQEAQGEAFDDAYDDDPDQSSQQDTERESQRGRNSTGRAKAPRFPASIVPPLPSNRKRAAPGDVQTCVRCKILKKGCDTRNPCADCPIMDENSSDYWKSLGCLHDMVKDLSERCVPMRRLTVRRDYFQENGTVLPLHFAYIDALDPEWERGVELLWQTQEFRLLKDECWENNSLRKSLLADLSDTSRSPADLVTSGKQLIWHQPGLGLIKLGSYNSTYVEKTAYNPFTLFRVGETVSKLSHLTPSELLLNASKLLVAIISMYQQEREILDFINEEPFSCYYPGDGSENAPIRLPNIRRHLEEFLRMFDYLFSRRTVLNAESWLAAFYALCFFSIAKSLLIDILFVRDNGKTTSSGHCSEAVQIGAVYKVLVSSFIWSAKIKSWCPLFSKTLDPMLVDWTVVENGLKNPISSTTREAFKETQAMIKQPLWADNSIKSTKDFLMNLGSGDFLDGRFSGFLVQRYGRKIHSFGTQPRPKAPAAFYSGEVVGSIAMQVSEISSAMDVDIPNPVSTSDGGRSIPITARTFDVAPRPNSRHRSVSRSSTYPQLSSGATSPRSEGPEPRKVRIYERANAPDLSGISHDSTNHPQTVSEYPSRSDDMNYLMQPPLRDPSQRSQSVAETPETPELDYTVAPGADYGRMKALVDASGAAMRDQDSSDTSVVFPPPRDDTPTMHGSLSSRTSTVVSADSPKMIPSRGLNRIAESQGDLRIIAQVARYPTDFRQAPLMTAGSILDDQSAPQNSHQLTESGDVLLQKGEKVVRMDVDSDRLRSLSSTKPPRMETLTFRLNEGYDSPRSSRGPKTQEKRERTAQMRKIGACDDCRRRKVPCDPRHERPRKSSISSPTAGVPILENDSEDATVDIVFVYDFNDNRLDSWATGDGSLWPKELIAKDIFNARIIICGYSSLSSSLKSPSLEDRTLIDMAQKLTEELESLRSSTVKQERPILFVGHSYGGLVIKKALILSQVLQESTIGALFLGTPHSPLHVFSPPMSRDNDPGRAQYGLDSNLFSMLQKGSMMLEAERDAFAIASRSMEIVCGYELRPTAGRIIVPQYAAVFHTRDVEIIPLDRDHAGLCRFPAKEEEGYKRVLRTIKRLSQIRKDRFKEERNP